MKYRILLSSFFIYACQLIFPLTANAEEIPVLVWERGQVQNVVLGQGDVGQSWKVYLKSSSGAKYEFEKSIKNSQGFWVYSLNLPKDLSLGGYVVEAENENAELRQVAGIQVIEGSIKEITRAPIEIFLVLFGLSLLLYFMSQIKSQRIKLFENFQPEQPSRFTGLSNRMSRALQSDEKTSLPRRLVLELLEIDNLLPKLNLIAGGIGLVILSGLQFSNGNLTLGNAWLLLACLLMGNTFITFGLIFSGLSFLYLILNIALAKSIGEIMAIFIISGLFILPAIYNQMLSKLSIFQSKNQKFNQILNSLCSAFIGALSAYQLILIYESVSASSRSVTSLKESLLILLTLFFFLKNLYISLFQEPVSEFLVVRAIGPFWSSILSLAFFALIYLWTTNVMVSTVAFISIFLIFSLNWLKFNIPKNFNTPKLDLYFGPIILVVFFTGLYVATRVLPLDVLNRSNLAILLTLPFDLLLASYLVLSNSQKWVNSKE